MRAHAIIASALFLTLFALPAVAERLALIGDRPDYTESNAAVPVDTCRRNLELRRPAPVTSLK